MPGERNQNFGLTYNGYAVGGSSGRPLHDVHFLQDGYVVARIGFDFILRGFATEALLDAAAIAAEDAFRTPRADLVLTNNGDTRKSLKHSDSTGFDADPIITKAGDKLFDSSWSQRFHVEIAFGRPANNVGTSGRRTCTVNCAFDSSYIATVTIEGEYTALPSGGGARATYLAAINTYTASVMGTLGIGTYDTLEDPAAEENATNKTLRFRRVLREVIHEEGGVSNDPELVGVQTKIAVAETAPGDSPPVRRLVNITVDFSASVRKDLTLDLLSKWESVFPALVAEAQQKFPDGSVGVVGVMRDFDVMNNRITAHLDLLGIASDVVENRVTTRDFIDWGNELDPGWVEGEPRAKYNFQGPVRIQRTITTVTVRAAGGAAGAAGGAGGGFQVGFGNFRPGVRINGRGAGAGGVVIGGGGGGGAAGGGAGVGPNVAPVPAAAAGCTEVPMTDDDSTTYVRKGVNGYSFDTTETTSIAVSEFFVPINAPKANTESGRAGRAG